MVLAAASVPTSRLTSAGHGRGCSGTSAVSTTGEASKKRSPVSNSQAGRDCVSPCSSPVYCQTFYQQSGFVRFFQVTSPSLGATGAAPAFVQQQSIELAVPEPSTSLQEMVMLQLDQKLDALRERAQAEGLGTRHATQADPWLDKILWEQYLSGQDLATTARLIDLPLQPAEDRRLGLLRASFDRLIEQTRSSIVEGEVNVFVDLM
jgi:hypothetical protein